LLRNGADLLLKDELNDLPLNKIVKKGDLESYKKLFAETEKQSYAQHMSENGE